MTAVIRTATAADDPALAALWRRCFDAPHIAALHALDPERHRHTFIAENTEGGIDAVVVHVPRLIRDAHGTPQRVGGIGSVATRPEARGQGLIRRLLAAAERTMTAEQCAWSLLFTGTPGVYRSSGWQEFAVTYTEGTLAPAAGGPDALPVREATARDAVEVAALHHAYNAGRPLSSLRAPEDWAVRVPAWYGPAEPSLVAVDPASGALTGWIVAQHVGDCVDVREFAGTAGGLGTLLAAVGARARAAGLTRARVRIPGSPAVTAALPVLLTDARQTTEHTGMARPLHATPASVRATVTAPGAVHWYGDCF
ncbi:GNAT family N-acetyltransferase [Streptomyces sp. NPDC048211]|uniref:GNAT family N-acetyltransferase n=1 Tax=Streptomyces sp. NPDC048211 TaxID=3365516 RepID=UPI003716A5D1